MKQYRALLTQNGNLAPTAEEETNTFGSEFTLARIAAGTYSLGLDNAFVGRVFYRLPPSEEGYANSVIMVREIHDDFIVIVTGTLDGQAIDGILGNVTGRGTPIEIDVYSE
jgi:hypothetical protein